MPRKSLPAGPGRPKGLKNKIPTGLKDKVLHACAVLEADGKDLATVAKGKPEWFYEHFVKPMLPKDIKLAGDVKSHVLVKVEFVRPQIDTDPAT